MMNWATGAALLWLLTFRQTCASGSQTAPSASYLSPAPKKKKYESMIKDRLGSLDKERAMCQARDKQTKDTYINIFSWRHW